MLEITNAKDTHKKLIEGFREKFLNLDKEENEWFINDLQSNFSLYHGDVDCGIGDDIIIDAEKVKVQFLKIEKLFVEAINDIVDDGRNYPDQDLGILKMQDYISINLEENNIELNTSLLVVFVRSYLVQVLEYYGYKNVKADFHGLYEFERICKIEKLCEFEIHFNY